MTVLQSGNWLSVKSSSQFMTKGSSHELASLLFTEVVRYSTLTLKKPVWALLLDRQTAFDSTLKEFVIPAVFDAMISNGVVVDQSVVYLANRLANRKTYLQYEHETLGPIDDNAGVEQGGIPSSEEYQLVSNSEVNALNESNLGVDVGAGTVACIAAADDEVVLSDSPHSLQSLLNLAQMFCRDTCMKLVPSKTHLLLFSIRNSKDFDYWSLINPIVMNGSRLPFSDTAEHVGVVRCASGSNLPAVTSRIAAHRKSIFHVLACGGARSHRGNPAASLAVKKLYSAPTLYSGLASLVLSRGELEAVSYHQKRCLERLQKLLPRTPSCAIMFLSGSLPAKALLDMKRLSLLGMISRLEKKNKLVSQAIFALHHQIKSSWFTEVRELCRLYSLPDPLIVSVILQLRIPGRRLSRLK